MKTRRFLLCVLTALPVLFLSSANRMGVAENRQSPVSGDDSHATKDRTLSPYFYIPRGNPGTDQLPLKSTSAAVNISGVIADITIKQEYSNEGIQPLEAIYVFPASTRAAVYSMKMTIGERTITAKIQEKEKARQEYEEARSKGQSASLLEQHRPNVFQMSVANILPGDRILVELKYTEILIPEEGIYRFVYPTVVGPRYHQAAPDMASREDGWVSNPYLHEKELPTYKFHLQCHISGGLPVSEVKCNTHRTIVQYPKASSVDIQLDPSEVAGGNRDFILEYRLAGSRTETGILLYPGEKENFFLAMIQPPRQIRPADIPAREYVFIVDVSGSMNGFPLEISKKLMHELIGNLRTMDRFNVILFAGGNSLFSDQSVPATPDNLRRALAFIDKEQGGGGTELLPALQRALQLPGTEEGYSRSFVIATDGYVTVEREAFDLIRRNLNRANFFPFGIGSSVNRHLIEGLAHAGGGLPFVIMDPSDAALEANRFNRYIGSPVLSHIQVEFEGFSAYDVEPLSIPDVLGERPVLVFGKYRGLAEGSLTLKGIDARGSYSEKLEMSKASSGQEHAAIRYLWARERIRNLDDFGGTESNNQEEITALGLKYQLLTRFTSFVAIDSEIRNKTGSSVTVQQPLPLPEGVSNLAVSGLAAPSPASYRLSTREAKVAEVAEVAEADQENIFIIAEQMPEFPGGEKALQDFISRNMVVPVKVREHQISGKVFISFIVQPDGRLTDISILRSLGGGCDEEALRLISIMPKWNPGRQNGKAVAVKHQLAIPFVHL